MGLRYSSARLAPLGPYVESVLRVARIPGAAIAIVADGKTLFAEGFGYRDLGTRLPMSEQTIYPIGSTTKAMNATLLGMLVDEGKLAWDRPVRDYLPGFSLHDPCSGAHVTVRDLLVMRTGLPRHDWCWSGSSISRELLVERLRYLAPSARVRERFSYNNMTTIAAGHIAEVVTGCSWEDLVQRRLIEPLMMKSTRVELGRSSRNTSSSYHESARRKLLLTHRSDTRVAGPAGGCLWSNVVDMTRWLSFNLQGGRVGRRRLIRAATLSEILSPQILTGADTTAPSGNASYAIGWYVDIYNGHKRVGHGGYLHDVNSDVSLFPEDGVGIVSFTNFGAPLPARILSEHAFDLLKGLKNVNGIDDALAKYEMRITDIRKVHASVRRVAGTAPSHSLQEYAGVYTHPAYGSFEVRRHGKRLFFYRHELNVELSHWHYDAWVARHAGVFPIHAPHILSPQYPLMFEMSADGTINAACLLFEPAVAPIRFDRAVIGQR